MDILRRGTDYGLRMMLVMAKDYGGGLISAKQLTEEGKFSYQLGCKLLQKLHSSDLLVSSMGAKGGFALKKAPEKITLAEIINALQDGICLNKCLDDDYHCEFKPDCEINAKLSTLQLYIEGYLGSITLAELIEEEKNEKKS